ncbi:MAG: MAPEG family protein [Rickettsiales bacterium]
MYALPALVTAISLALYMVLGFQVGQARGKYGVKAPATSGHEMFDRALRIQMNTLEQLVFFLPSLWLFTIYLDMPKLAAALGAVWIIGRVLYVRAYTRDPKTRVLGFVLTITPASILLLGGFVGIGQQLLAA